MDQATNLVKAVEDLNGRGYVREFRIKDGQLHDFTTGKSIDASALHVDVSLRFENGQDAKDGSSLYAITATGTGHKGLLIDAFDTLDRECARELFERLSVARETLREENATATSRYGLRKVFKAEFDGDPERYVLRIGFPDFPPCPFGQSFSVLGFDSAGQEYVWLVTSILRDARLKRVPFHETFSEEE